MRLLTLGEAKSSVARALGMSSTDARVATLINEAQERILNRSEKPVGSMVRYRFCVNESCIVLPRSIRTIESFAICSTPGIVRPEWHEFLGNGTELYDEDDIPGRMMVDHGRTVTFNSVDPGQSVTVVTVTAGGSGYSSAPTVVFTNASGDTTGTGAAGTAVLTAGAVTSVTITDSGSGYTSAPTITFTGGGGSGATATATIARNRLIRVQSSVAESSGTTILLLGYDSSGQWVRTLDSGSWIDGEKVTISSTATNSSTTWSSLERVVKPVTNGVVRLYTWDQTAAKIQRSLAAYEPSEKLPVYRRMFIPGIKHMGTCPDATGSCSDKSVTVLAKLQHVPVIADNDFLVIGNLAALKLMATAIQREEQNRLGEAEAYEVKALRELEGERSSYDGDGAKVEIKASDKGTWGAAVFNPV